MFAQIIVEMLPGTSMSRSILRTFGFEYGGDTQNQGMTLIILIFNFIRF